MTQKELINRIVKGCDNCPSQGSPADPCYQFGCDREITPEALREIELAFLCEECEDMPVTNLFGDENNNEYRCNSCKKIDDEGNRGGEVD
jgi:hypothetical protein